MDPQRINKPVQLESGKNEAYDSCKSNVSRTHHGPTPRQRCGRLNVPLEQNVEQWFRAYQPEFYKNREFKREMGIIMLVALKTIAIGVVYGNKEQFTQTLGQSKLFSISTMLMSTSAIFR